jgi:copper chaperone CopZ
MKKENFEEEMISIKGMHCKSCVSLIESKLNSLKGVDNARVSLVEENAYVSFDQKKTNLDEIKAEIESLGYKTDAHQTDTQNKNDTQSKSKSSIKQGIIYGLIPHIGCITFIVASVLGVTVATQLFKPLLLNPYFFYILIFLSFVFATVSAVFYFKRQGFISLSKSKEGSELSFSTQGIKRKWKYLSTLYGTTIGINLLLFMIIFPLLANVSLASTTTGALAGVDAKDLSLLKLQVAIPCPGHAPLITGELKTINGVADVQFSFPNNFDVKYDSTKATKQQILALDVFKTYKATVISESQSSSTDQASTNQISSAAVTGNAVKSSGGSNLATVTNGVQTVQLSVQGTNYYPNPIHVKKGIPVKLVADMNNMPGCSVSIVIPEFGIRKVLSAGDNVIEFTPDKSGTFQFSCSMNMYRGQIVVEEADGSVAAYTGATPATTSGSCGGGSGCGGSCGGSSGGCGCGSK